MCCALLVMPANVVCVSVNQCLPKGVHGLLFELSEHMLEGGMLFSGAGGYAVWLGHLGMVYQG